MLFDWLLHSKTRLRMLKLFFRDVSRPLYGLEISQKLNASPGTTHRELNAMIKKGVVKKKKMGALVMYSLDVESPHFLALQQTVKPSGMSSKVVFVSDLMMSDVYDAKFMNDVNRLIDYVTQSASELVFLGNTFDLLDGNPLNAYLLHKPIIDRIVKLSNRIKVTMVTGDRDCLLAPMIEDGSLFGSKISLVNEYRHATLKIHAEYGNRWEKTDHSKLADSTGMYGNPKYLFQSLRSVESPDKYYEQLRSLAAYGHLQWKKAKARGEKRGVSLEKAMTVKAREILKREKVNYVVCGYSGIPKAESFKNGQYLCPGSFRRDGSFVEIGCEGAEVKKI